VNAAAVAAHLSLTRQQVSRLVDAGVLSRTRDGKFDLDACRLDYIRFLRDDRRRSPKSSAAARVQELRAEKLRLELARERGQLIDIGEVELAVEDILGAYVAEMGGVPAAVTRDAALRRVIEEKYSDAMDRCRARFDAAIAALSRGEAPLEDDPEAAA
jgi:hypothetical protein